MPPNSAARSPALHRTLSATEARSTGPPPRLTGLDGLRGIACLMVFGVHFAQTAKVQGRWGPFDLAQWFANGNSGVALFFALSGFVLSLPFWQATAPGASPVSLRSYFARRAARILPAYLACLIGLVVIRSLWRSADDRQEVLLHLLLVFNFHGPSVFSINPPFWTLAVEAQFYLLLPVLMAILPRHSPVLSCMALVALSAAAYAAHFMINAAAVASAVEGQAPSPALTYSLLAHLPHFLLGMATSRLFVARSRSSVPGTAPKPWLSEALLAASLAAILVILSTPIDALLQIPFGRYNLPYLPLLLCAVIALTPGTALGRQLLGSAPLRGLGLISYGVYIYHLPIQNFLARQMPRISLNPVDHWAVFGAVSLALTLAVALLSYQWLERPIVRALRRT